MSRGTINASIASLRCRWARLTRWQRIIAIVGMNEIRALVFALPAALALGEFRSFVLSYVSVLLVFAVIAYRQARRSLVA